MNMKIYLIVIIVSLAAIIAFLYRTIPFDPGVSSSLQAAGVIGALIISIITLGIAYNEYKHHKNAANTNLICQYMHRYANDKYVLKMKKYILETAVLDEEGRIIGFNKNAKPSYVPKIFEKEAFMCIFQELQLCIDAKMIPREKAIEYFGYYASVFHRIKEYHSDLTDYYNENYWKDYLTFVNSIDPNFHKL